MTFRTRFAPSPTGPLHLGHAYSAILGHDMARAADGAFLLRMEDTDFQRCKPEWDAQIVSDLEWLGLTWDEPVPRQSAQLEGYMPAIDALIAADLIYPCSCSRSDILAAQSAPQEGVTSPVYPGTCKHRSMSSRQPGDALRLHLDRALAQFQGNLPSFVETGSAHHGKHVITPDEAIHKIGDIVLFRKSDGIVAYFLASALDDVSQGITHVVRGEDLFEFTPIQVLLLALLGHASPIYHHHKLIRDDAGKRLAKRDDARAISKYREDGLSPHDIREMLELAG